MKPNWNNTYNWAMLFVSYFMVVLLFLLVIAREAHPLVGVPAPSLFNIAAVITLWLFNAKMCEMRIKSTKKERHETN
jgi:hypothetical protein